MNLFKDMISLGVLNTSDRIQIYCLRLCFMHIIQNDLNRVSQEWNTHTITAKKNAEGPRGKPDIMYFAPNTIGAESHGYRCDVEKVETALDAVMQNDAVNPDHDPVFVQLVDDILPNWVEPVDVDAALELYGLIMDEITRYE